MTSSVYHIRWKAGNLIGANGLCDVANATFHHVGEVVTFLTNICWLVPGFAEVPHGNFVTLGFQCRELALA